MVAKAAKTMVGRRQVLGSAAVAALLPAGLAAAEATLQGSVSWRERMALPAGSTVEVKLLDVSRADAPADTIAATSVAAGPGSPVPYRLDYDPARIEPNRRYALQARIMAGDRLLFINTSHHPIFAGGPDRTDIEVQRVQAAPAADQASPAGKWLAEDILGGGVIDNLQTVLELAEDGTVSGTGGCNRIIGKAKIAGDGIEFGPMGSTMMACTPAVMDQERKFLDALGLARTFRVDGQQRKLILQDAAGQTVVRLAAM